MTVSADEKIILITGANRGIGLAIIQAAASRVGPATFILTCRTPSKGNEAVKSLRAAGVSNKIEVLQLDIMDDGSIEAAASHVSKVYGRLDGKNYVTPEPHTIEILVFNTYIKVLTNIPSSYQ